MADETIDLAAELATLQKRNQTKLMQIKAAGGPEISLLGALVDHLIVGVFPDEDARREFLISWELRCAFMLEEIDKQIRMATLVNTGRERLLN